MKRPFVLYLLCLLLAILSLNGLVVGFLPLLSLTGLPGKASLVVA